MRALAIILGLLCAAPLWADGLTITQRLEDCLGPRAEAMAREMWENAPCQQEGNCPEFDPRLYYSVPHEQIKCVFEAHRICALQPEGVVACHSKVVAFVEQNNAEILKELSSDRLANVKARADGVWSRRVERVIEKLETLSISSGLECPQDDQWCYRALGREQACNAKAQLDRFAKLSSHKHSIDSIERRLQQ